MSEIFYPKCQKADQWFDLKYSYDDLYKTPIADLPFEVTCERNPAVRVRGVTNSKGEAHVEGLLPGPLQVVFNPDNDALAEQEAARLRTELKSTLDGILSGIEANAALKEEAWQDKSVIEKGAAYSGAFVRGVWDGATDFVDFIAQAGEILASLGLAYMDLWQCIVSGDIKGLQAKMEEARSDGQEMADSAMETAENLFLLLSDEEVRDMLYEFPQSYWDAHHSVDQAYMAGSAGSDIVVGLVIGALSGGTGAVAMAGKSVAKGGQTMGKAMGLIKDLSKQLKKIKPKQKFRGATQGKGNYDLKTSKTNHPMNGNHAGDNNRGGSNQNGDLCQANHKTCQSGEPISMITGEELLQQIDFTVPGLLPLSWVRHYRTSNNRNRGLGHGWTFPTCETLQLGNDAVLYNEREGRQIEFPVPAIGQFTTNSTEGLFLHRDWHNIFYLKQPGQPDKLFVGPESHSANGSAVTTGTLRLMALIDSVGNRWDCFYNPDNQQIERMESSWGAVLNFHNNYHGLIERIEDSNGTLLVTYHYNVENDLVAVEDAGGDAESFQYQNHVITERTLRTGFHFYFQWDQYNNQARCLRQWGDNGIYDYRFEWDPKNRINKSIDSNGGVLEIHYDRRGLVEKEIDPQGHVTEYQYDRHCRKIKTVDAMGFEHHFRYDKAGNLAAESDSAGGGYTLLYDKQHRPVCYSDAEGNRWQREYNEMGLVSKTIDAEGNATQYFYNEEGLPQIIVDPMGNRRLLAWNTIGQLQTQVIGDGEPSHYQYDSHGNLAIVQQGEQTTRYQHNIKGDLCAVLYPDGGQAKLQYNANRQLTAYTDPLGRTTQFEYDGLAQITRRIDPMGQVLQYQYDKERNLIGLVNEKGEQYQLKYDANERLIEEVGFDGRVQQYQYNPLGHLTAHLEGSGEAEHNTTHFMRDPMGRLLQKKAPDGETNTFAYDKNGRLISAANRHRSLVFEYSPNGHLINELQDHHPLQHQYNPLGQRISSSLPNGSDIAYQYDQWGQFTALDYNGRRLTQLQRNHLGIEIGRSQGTLQSAFEYDPAGRLTQHKVQAQHSRHAVITRHYAYDNAGRLNQIRDLHKGTTQYHYDPLDRLQKVEGYAQEQFEFDPAGNILSGQNSSQSTQNQQGNTSKGNRLAFHGDRHFTYDERGNLTEERRGTGGRLNTRYTYNSQNQLIQVEKDGQTTHYQYDPLGRRVSKQDEFGTTEFLWNGDVLLSEHRNHKEKVYLYEPNSFKPLCFIENNQCYFYHLDHLGTPQELTNWEGQVVWSARYKVYGNVVRKEVEQVENNIRFQGQYYDEETGLHYNRHRYYDPSTGQFTQQDLIGLLGGINCYQYVPNPTGWTDPLGMKCKENTWNEFQKDHKGQFKSPAEASKAYKELKDNQSPWPHGYDPESNVRTMQPGDTFNMIVDSKMEDMPGRFGTTDSIPNAEYGRQNLAIKEGWKPTLDNVVTYRARKSFDVYEGPVGPQIDGGTYLKGGGSQITFKDPKTSWANARPNEYNDFTDDPYLEIVDIKKLDE